MILNTGELNYKEHEALGVILDNMGLLALDEDMPKYIKIEIGVDNE